MGRTWFFLQSRREPDMPPDRRTLRDIRSAYRGMWEYQRQIGQWACWFRFNKAATTVMPIYDTGPQRAWFNPVTLPVHLGEYRRAGENFNDDGLYLVDTLHLIFSYDAFFHTGMPDPDLTGQNHQNDRVAFDGRLFSVSTFYPRGRVADYFLTISVDAIEVAQSELNEDVDIPIFAPYITVPDVQTPAVTPGFGGFGTDRLYAED
jgi:hypothetical protein